MRKNGIILISLISLILGVMGLILFTLCVKSYSEVGITLKEILLWCEDTVLRYNTNLSAKGNAIFVFVISIIIFLSFIVYLVLVLKKKQYLSVIPVVLFGFTGILACLTYFYFFYCDYNFGLYATVGLIDIDYFLLVINSIGFAVGVAGMVLVTMELVTKTRQKYDPLTIYHF